MGHWFLSPNRLPIWLSVLDTQNPFNRAGPLCHHHGSVSQSSLAGVQATEGVGRDCAGWNTKTRVVDHSAGLLGLNRGIPKTGCA